MRPVITISLNGNSYQVEQEGYEALRAYLGIAEARLADNPDKAEILADLEQAIAEKFGRYLNPHKTVVTGEEVQQVIREMGPVDGGAAEQAAGAGGAGAGQQSQGAEQAGAGKAPGKGSAGKERRLYQIREGAMISGVCNGFAAYFNVDVTLVRLIFVALAIVTGGAFVIGYLIMMFVIPYADTPEEQAAAHGWAFNAQELIDRAKQHYAQFKDGQQWRNKWREQRRFWKAQQRQWRAEARYWREYQRTAPPTPPAWAPPPENVSRAAYILGGLFLPFAAILNVVLFLALLGAILSLVMTHAVLGWMLPPHIPLWVAIVLAIVLYHVVASPLHFARHAGYYGPFGHGWYALWGAMLWTAIVVACVWVALLHWPDVQHFLEHLSALIQQLNFGGHAPAIST